jgi:hypothetical protein
VTSRLPLDFADFLRGLLFDPEHGDDMALINVDGFIPKYRALHLEDRNFHSLILFPVFILTVPPLKSH